MATREENALRTAKEYYDRGNARLDSGDLDNAFADINEAIKLVPEAWARLTLRRMGCRHSQKDGAEDIFYFFLDIGNPTYYINNANSQKSLYF